MSTNDTSGLRKGLKIAVLVVALGLAVFLGLRGGSNEGQLDTPASAEPYICLDDGHVVQLTPAQWQKLAEQGDVQEVAVGGDPDRVGRGSDARLMIRCPKCQQFTMGKAMPCPNGSFVPVINKEGQPGKCP